MSIFTRTIVLACLSLLAVAAKAQVTAGFTASPTSGCANLTVFLSSATSTGTINSYSWQITNATTGATVFSSALANPVFIFPAGTYSVCLTVTGAGGATNQLCQQSFIHSYGPPTAAFTVTPATGCTPLNATFHNTSVAGSCPITSVNWIFGDGSPSSTAASPSHTYSTTNPQLTFNPTLQITDQCGCTSFVTGSAAQNNQIIISQQPTASFAITSPLQVCTPPLIATFQNNSSNPSGNGTNYSWNFGTAPTSTLQNPTHTYTTVGSYPIGLTVSDAVTGCSASTTSNANIQIGSGTVNFYYNSSGSCPGHDYEFVDQTTGGVVGNWSWDFGDGSPPATIAHPFHSYTAPGCYTVTLTATVNGCPGTHTIPNCITVYPVPTVQATAPNLQSCNLPFTVNFNATSTNATTWTWDFGDNSPTSNLQNPSHTYTTTGNYTATVTAANAHCSATSTAIVQIQAPQAAFTVNPTQGCVPLSVGITDQSFSLFPITSWQWSFTGPGTTPGPQAAQNPANLIFPDTGCYNIRLIVVNSNGCTDTVTQQHAFCAGMQLTPNFTAVPLNICARDQVQFTNLTQGNVTHVLWDFGDHSTSSSPNPLHQYSALDSMDVSLTVTNYGCDSTTTRNHYIVVQPPIARFTYHQSCNPDSLFIVSFKQTCIRADSFYWDFGVPGITTDVSTDSTPTFDYTPYGRGSYTVTLIAVNDTTHCHFPVTHSVTIAEPIANFTVTQDTGCAMFTVPITVTTQDANTYQWTAPGATITGGATANPSITYDNGVWSPIQLVIADVNGCRDTATFTDSIYVSRITPNFTVVNQQGCAPLTSIFTDASTTYLGTINSINWNFGASAVPSAATGVQQTVVYPIPGNYQVTQTITNTLGCSYTVTNPQSIQATFPFPAFSTQPVVCGGHPVNFSNTSTGTSLTYHWDFGTGNPADTSNLAIPSFSYNTDGVYTICLHATDVYGCDSTVCHNITVQTPVAAFTGVPSVASCPPLVVNFGNQSLNAVSWQWTFGDNIGTSIQANPNYIYTVPDTFTVQLIVTSAIGCRDTLTRTDYIQISGPRATINFTPNQGCVPLPVAFTVNYYNTDSVSIITGDGGYIRQAVSPSTGTLTATYTYPYGGTYYPAVQVKDSTGCAVTYFSPNPVTVDTLQLRAIATDSVLCTNDCITFTANVHSGSSASNILWTFPGGTPATATGLTANVCYPTTGNYGVTLSASNSHCADTVTRSTYINVGAYPQASFTLSPNNQCVPVQVNYTNTSTGPGPLTYAWDYTHNNSTDTTGTNATHLFATAGTFNTQLTVTTPNGCADSVVNTVTTLALPIADAGSNVAICLGTSTTLGATGGATYAWSPVTGLSDPTIANPVASPLVTTMYYVTVTSANGCTATDSVRVTIHTLPTVNAGADQAVCNGHTATFTAVGAAGGGSYTYHWSAGTPPTTAAITVTPTLPGAMYYVTVTDAFGCTGTDSVHVTVNPLPVITAATANDSLCNGFTTTLTAAGIGAGGGYLWSTNETTTSIAVVPPAIGNNVYTVTGTDSNGCTASASTSVFIFALPQVTITSDTGIICIRDTAHLSSTPTGAGYTYAWSPAGSLSSSTAYNPLAFPTVTTTYTLTVTNSIGCTGTSSYTQHVSPFALPTIALSHDTTICYGQYVQLFVSGGFNTTTAYTWNASVPGLTCYDGCSNPVASPLVSSTYTVTVEGQGGCKDDAHVRVNVVDYRVPLLPGDSVVCVGDTVDLMVATGNNPHWVTTDNISCNACAIVRVYPHADTAKYVVNVTINGCPVSDSINIYHLIPADLSAGPDLLMCVGDSVMLLGHGPGTVIWTPSTGLSNPRIFQPMAHPAITTQYIMHVTDGACSLSDTMKVRVTDHVQVSAPDVTTCPNEPVTLHATGTATRWLWSPAANLDLDTVPNPNATVAQSTMFAVTGFLGACPPGTDSVLVNVHFPVTLPATYNVSYFPGQTLTMQIPGISHPSSYTYVWQPDSLLSCNTCFNPSLIPTHSMTLSVTVTDSLNCSSSMQFFLSPLDRCSADVVVVPNAFTPNNDGLNDVLYARSTALSNISKFDVYTRWGEHVFHSENMSQGWDGTYNNEPASSGVYVYFVEFTCPVDNSTIVKKGNVTLLR